MINTAKELIDYVINEYMKYDVELNSEHFNVSVSMKKRDILNAYIELQRRINGDVIFYADPETGLKVDCLNTIWFSIRKEILDLNSTYSGNCKDFLESLNGLFGRFVEGEEIDFIL